MDGGERSSDSRYSATSAGGDTVKVVKQILKRDAGQILIDDDQSARGPSNLLDEVDTETNENTVYEGMVFESEEKAFDRYDEFARKMGFVVRRDKLVKRADGTVRKRVFVCFKQGIRKKDYRYQYVKKERPQVRTNCMARMVIKYEKDDTWVVSNVIYEHNHLLTTPSTYTLRSKRKIVGGQIGEAKDLKEIPLAGGLDCAGQQLGGCEDVEVVQNVLGITRKEEFKKDDIYAIVDYFKMKQLENPSFFYSVIVDNDNKLANLFWADARSIMDYKYFGDVIVFDTTLLTGRKGWSFAPFIGFNHHKQNVLLGGAFVLDKTTESFVRLFETFMKAMSGCKPKIILTDHYEAVKEAISIVIPEAQHRLSLYHIFKNGVNHIPFLYKLPEFQYEFSKCLYSNDTEEDFISGWSKILQKYSLARNKWLGDLFKVREKWALVYGRENVYANMTTTEHGRTISKFMKKFVKRTYSFPEFIARYEKAVESWRQMELHEDFHSTRELPSLFVPAPMLKQAADTYTRVVFEMFLEEYKQWLLCKIEEYGVDGTIYKYEVTQEKNVTGLVTIDSSDCHVVCSCKKFYFIGILCRHMIKVLYHRNIHELPTQYILKRWTKDAKTEIVRDRHGNPIQSDCMAHILFRYNDLFGKAISIARKGALNEEVYSVAKRVLDNVLIEVESAINATTRKPQEYALQTSLVTQPHNAEENVGEQMIMALENESRSFRLMNGVEIDHRKKKSRTADADSNSGANVNHPQEQGEEEGHSNIASVGNKSNGHRSSSLQLVATPISAPIQYMPAGMSDSAQSLYSIASPKFIRNQNSQGFGPSGFEARPFSTHNTMEASFSQLSNQVSATDGALLLSTCMELPPHNGASGFESSEDSLDSDELQFSLLGDGSYM